jgi:hypothetical protein
MSTGRMLHNKQPHADQIKQGEPRVHKRPPVDPVLKQLTPVQTLTRFF